MTNVQLIILIVDIIGSNLAIMLYLSYRIDRMEDRLTSAITQLGAKIDKEDNA